MSGCGPGEERCLMRCLGPRSIWHIEYCPRHAAVDDLVAALKRICDYAEKDMPGHMHDEARHVLAGIGEDVKP